MPTKRKGQRPRHTRITCTACHRRKGVPAFARGGTICRQCRQWRTPPERSTAVTVPLGHDRVLRIARVEKVITIVEGFRVGRAASPAVSPLYGGRVRLPVEELATFQRELQRVGGTR